MNPGSPGPSITRCTQPPQPPPPLLRRLRTYVLRLYVVALSRPRELSPGGDRLGPRTAHEVRAVEFELRAWWGCSCG